MQITINNTNIVTFGFSITFDVANQSVIFNIAALTEFNGSGGTLIQGINFSLNDASGNPLIAGNSGNGTWDWDSPNILIPSTDLNPDYSGESTYTLDLSAIWGSNYQILFQTYKIQGAIKDENGTVYETGVLIQNVCQPKGLTDLGYILGEITLKPDCPNGFLTVKEVTNLAYNGALPDTQSSEGTLYYPRGTIDPIEYTFTDQTVDFTNNVVYTGNYKIQNTTTALYYYDQDFIVQLEYYTSSEKYDVTCEKQMLSVMCCLTDYQVKMTQICTGAQAAAMQAKWAEAGTYLAYGLVRESSGRDASAQAAKIRQILSCNCGDNAIRKIAPDPVNPIIYSIVVTGQYGTTVTPSVVGNTKTFLTSSNVYRVQKLDNTDTAFSITTVTAPGLVTYKIAFDYEALAANILNEINDSQTLINQFNGLIDLSDINGKCILDNGASNYFLAQRIASSLAVWTSVIINSVTYAAPGGLLVSDTAGAKAWLDGLGVGVYTVDYSTDGVAFYVNVLSENNTYQPLSALFGSTTSLFQKTTKSLKAFFQSVYDYVCEQSAVDLPIGETVTVCNTDYNGEITYTEYDTVTPISDLLTALSTVGCNIIGWVKASVIAGARNGIYKTVDGGGLPEFRLGTNALIENTTINQAGFAFSINNGALFIREFGTEAVTYISYEGLSGSNYVTSALFNTLVNALVISTNTDRALIAYYAKSMVKNVGTTAFIGSAIPDTLDPIGNPAPADDPDTTARVKTDTGTIEYYGKTQTVNGETFNFNNAIPILPLLTTAQRVALTPAAGWKCYDTDFGAEMVYSATNSTWYGTRYNTGTSKFQGYNGTTWIDLN